jgi:hypothetical protein
MYRLVHLKDLGIDGRQMLKCILEIKYEDMDWIHLDGVKLKNVPRSTASSTVLSFRSIKITYSSLPNLHLSFNLLYIHKEKLFIKGYINKEFFHPLIHKKQSSRILQNVLITTILILENNIWNQTFNFM